MIEVHPEAQAEIDEAVFSHEDAGVRLLRLIDRLVLLIERFPKNGTLVLDHDTPYELRRYALRTFPYQLFVLDRNGTLHLIACAHTKREPGYWKERLQ